MADKLSVGDFEKCIKVYDAMFEASQVLHRDGFEGNVYQGRLTHLFNSLGIAMPHYTPIMGALKAMGCCGQLRRGGGTANSEWALFFMPTKPMFEALNKKSPRVNSNHQSEQQQTQQQLRDLKVLYQDQDRRIKLLELIVLGDRGAEEVLEEKETDELINSMHEED